MALSRILSRSLLSASLRTSSALTSHHRHRSSKPNRGQLIEVDLDAASPSQPDSSDPAAAADVVAFGIKKLEEAIHSVIVRRAAPDWLPFLPGHSYWVPPRRASARNHPAGGMIGVLEKLTSSQPTRNHRSQPELLSEDEQMSLQSVKGWPSSAYFIEGTSPQHPKSMIVLSATSSSKDDEP